MCGIFGYAYFNSPKSIDHILTTLFDGLQRLEYRGYDSAGISLDLPLAGEHDESKQLWDSPSEKVQAGYPEVMKSSGKISILKQMTYENFKSRKVQLDLKRQANVAIGHTRWATHGPPTANNSHPHVSDGKREFIVVHNGIITNYSVLKEFLTKHGDSFETDTDTEVVPKMFKYLYNLHGRGQVSFPKLAMEVMGRLEGAFALLVKSTHYPNEVVACRRGSPLIFGKRTELFEDSDSDDSDRILSGNRPPAHECWFASDPGAVIPHTNKVIMLEDEDVLHLTSQGFDIYNAAAADKEMAVDRMLQTLQMEVEEMMKGGYDHYMQKEIHEQPDSVAQTMSGRVLLECDAGRTHTMQPSIRLGGLKDHITAIRRSSRIMFIACGTSYNACLASRPTMEEMSGLPVMLELASDLLDRQAPIFRDDCCVFVSQSGETADTLMALEYAKSAGALCIGITNAVGSAISRNTHAGVHLCCGKEIGVASTKAYTSQIVSIIMMALSLSADSISKSLRRTHIIHELATLPDRIREALKLDRPMQMLAAQLKDAEHMLFFARGYNYATALEAALKVKEVALIHSEGMSAGEMKHGPLALVDEHIPILVVATRDSMHRKMESVIQQLLARKAKLVILCNDGDKSMNQYDDGRCSLIRVPTVVDALQPIVNIIPLQLLSYHLTVLRGFNVDQPRNLAKSVTVSEE